MTVDEKYQVLFVLDCMTELPIDESLLRILRNNHVHIVAVYNSFTLQNLDKLIREIDQKLVRGCTIHNIIEPLRMIHATQRMVFSVMQKYDFTPTNADQRMFEKLAELALGSPLIIDTTVQLLLDCLKSMESEGIQYLGQKLQLGEPEESYACTPDLFNSMKNLLTCCRLSHAEQLLLNSLSIFAGGPMPMLLVTEMSHLITQANHRVHLADSLHKKLISHKLLLQYPLPVIVHQKLIPEYSNIELVYVPQHMAQHVQKDMKETDKIAALTVACHAMHQLVNSKSPVKCDILGPWSLLIEKNHKLIGKECYKALSFYISCSLGLSPPPILGTSILLLYM